MIRLLKKLGACSEGIKFAASAKDFQTAWETCKRADWMLWGLRKIGFSDDKKMRLFACACIRLTPAGKGKTVWDLLNDERSRNAVVVAERYASGEATGEELKAAADAAYAATYATYAVTYAAVYAAYAAQSDLLRQWISWDEVEKALTSTATALSREG